MPTALPKAVESCSELRDVLRCSREVRERIYSSGQMRDATGAMRPVWPVGLTKGRGEALREIARSCQAIHILETGLGLAMSSSYLLDAAIETLIERGGVFQEVFAGAPLLTSIDPGERDQNADAGLLHLQDAGLARFHRFIDDRSELALPELVRRGERFDLVFVDGNHLFDGAMIDTFYALRLVKPGGLIVLDDVWMPAVSKASAFYVSNGLCERVGVFAEGGKERLHTLRLASETDSRNWDHFVEF